MRNKTAPLMLVILDGWGLGHPTAENAIYLAKTPYMDSFQQKHSYAEIEASGESVGLPAGQMGNSEVGHLNIGAGRAVYQELTRINLSIREKAFFQNKVFLDAMERAKKGATLHLLGLVSDGGVHSHLEHLYALLRLVKEHSLPEVYIHAILDGRDVPPANAADYLKPLEEYVANEKNIFLATVAGRYYTMDRDNRWERIEKAYRAMVTGEGEKATDSLVALQQAYRRGETDEFVLPTVLVDENGNPRGQVKKDDVLLFFNFRPDRARQITYTFMAEDFPHFERGEPFVQPFFVSMTSYDKTLETAIAFPSQSLKNTLGEVLSYHGLRQLRIAETEKYAHVTFFFNGGVEKPSPGEIRTLIPSPKVATYDLQPSMSAPEVTKVLLDKLSAGIFDVIILNYANADMVGHTGDLQAAVEAVETVDECLGQVVNKVLELKGVVCITADHGNAELMLDKKEGQADRPHTAHTTNRVPFVLVNERGLKIKDSGVLADIAPTILEILHIAIPQEMTGNSLLKGEI